MHRIGVVSLCLSLLALGCGGEATRSGSEEPPPATSPTDGLDTATTVPEAVEFVPGPLGAVEVAPGAEIQIRSLNTITGVTAFAGIPNQRGVELAIADYGPIAGRSVSLGTPLDDFCSPDGGQAAAQTIVADPSVVGVIGTTCSSSAAAAMPLISAAGMVMISPSNASPWLTSDLAGNVGSAYLPGYYRTCYNGLVQGRAVASFVRDYLGFDRAATIHDGDAFTQGLAQSFADAFEELGGVSTAIAAVNKSDTDMIGVLTGVGPGSPQAVFLPVFMPEGGFIAQQIGGVSGLERVTLVGAAPLLVDNFMELPESEGVFLSGPDLRYGSNRNSITGASADDFRAAYDAAYGEAPSTGFWAHAYDATIMLLRAIDRVAIDVEGTLYVDRQALREELHRTSFDGITGSIKCDEYGDCGAQRIAVVEHTDPQDVEAGKDNVVFEYAP
ncbi:MAG: branched-chain amino acid ABC transporter substrate-binding protein [bacterium]|nr:branched-chain amino acid ABC transporter substrate-binding protein [bacterium]